MTERDRSSVRVLVADDEAEVRDAYQQILIEADVSKDLAAFRDLRARLFSKTSPDTVAQGVAEKSPAFDPLFVKDAAAAVEAVRDAVAAGRPFAVAFLDMRMPPGHDGVWAAARIRELDPAIEIVICTAYSDTDPAAIGGLVPPEDKLSYLQKPFHPHEIRQMTISLGSKWRAEHRIVKLAYFDPLTGLANRQQSQSCLGSAIHTAVKTRQSLAVLYLDLDNFKRINDTLGHSVGDELLCLVAARLRRALRSGDGGSGEDGSGEFGKNLRSGHIARFGGDEFVMILPQLANCEDAGVVAGRLIEELQAPMSLAKHTVVITPSIGIAICPADGTDVASLLRNADLAMYFAKRRGPASYAYFDTQMNTVALQRFKIEGQLRGALQRGEFTVHYQPQFDVRLGTISGMEALLRWTNPELGAVSPADFVPVAEETGLIMEIGEWVLRTACVQARAWRDEGLPPVRMAVNVSGQQFTSKEFPQVVAGIIHDTGIDPALLELEITESVIMKDETWAEHAFAQLKEVGVRLAIDDFGTGYSSLGRLRNFAVDRLKIDRSFVASLLDCSDDRAIAAAIIAMSHALRIQVTAEGVESFPQLMFLQEHECQEAQGFLFSHALDAADAARLLHRAAEAAQAGDGSRTTRLRSLIG
ncbi:MAG TPA: EAL domain-containing protein [Steroidobacteraceae bacterium]|nr:EAL domain-containing protein [Steroidobacteraceae bacterium]